MKIIAVILFALVTIWAGYNSTHDKAIIGPYIAGIFLAGFICYAFNLT